MTFQHDCDRCVPIGHYEGHDLYRCDQESVGIPTIVARFGDDGPDYLSGPSIVVGRVRFTALAAEEAR